MREQTKVYLNRIISVMMNYFNSTNLTLSIKRSMPISIMPTHNLSNFNRIIIRFCKTIILILELTKIFVNQIIMKSLKIKENNTIWKMKIEEDRHNK